MYLKSIITASLLALSPASALTLDIHSDTIKKIDFTVDWSDGGPPLPPFGQPAFIYYQGINGFSIEWGESQSSVDAGIYMRLAPEIGPFGGDIGAGFHFNYLSKSATGEYLGVSNAAAGAIEWAKAKMHPSGYSARFSFTKQPHNLPDAGSTLLLLGLSLPLLIGWKIRKS